MEELNQRMTITEASMRSLPTPQSQIQQVLYKMQAHLSHLSGAVTARQNPWASHWYEQGNIPLSHKFSVLWTVFEARMGTWGALACILGFFCSSSV